MQPIIKDNATPKTGGVTNRAQPTAASSFKLATLPEGQSRFIGEPNFAPPRHKKTKRTQSTLPKTQIFETNPIYRPAAPLFTIHCSLFTILQNEPNPSLPRCPKGSPDSSGNPLSTRQKRETNPILRPPASCRLPQPPIMRNEPNFPYHHHPTDPISRNKPNFPYRWRLAGITIPKICETNPISARRTKY